MPKNVKKRDAAVSLCRGFYHVIDEKLKDVKTQDIQTIKLNIAEAFQSWFAAFNPAKLVVANNIYVDEKQTDLYEVSFTLSGVTMRYRFRLSSVGVEGIVAYGDTADAAVDVIKSAYSSKGPSAEQVEALKKFLHPEKEVINSNEPATKIITKKKPRTASLTSTADSGSSALLANVGGVVTSSRRTSIQSIPSNLEINRRLPAKYPKSNKEIEEENNGAAAKVKKIGMWKQTYAELDHPRAANTPEQQRSASDVTSGSTTQRTPENITPTDEPSSSRSAESKTRSSAPALSHDETIVIGNITYKISLGSNDQGNNSKITILKNEKPIIISGEEQVQAFLSCIQINFSERKVLFDSNKDTTWFVKASDFIHKAKSKPKSKEAEALSKAVDIIYFNSGVIPDLAKIITKGSFLSGLEFRGKLDLSEIPKKELASIDFSKTKFDDVTFNEVRFDKDNFKDAKFDKVTFRLVTNSLKPNTDFMTVTIDNKTNVIKLKRGDATIVLTTEKEREDFLKAVEKEYADTSKKESIFFSKKLSDNKKIKNSKDTFGKLKYLLMDRANENPDRLTTHSIVQVFDSFHKKQTITKKKIDTALDIETKMQLVSDFADNFPVKMEKIDDVIAAAKVCNQYYRGEELKSIFEEKIYPAFLNCVVQKSLSDNELKKFAEFAEQVNERYLFPKGDIEDLKEFCRIQWVEKASPAGLIGKQEMIMRSIENSKIAAPSVINMMSVLIAYKSTKEPIERAMQTWLNYTNLSELNSILKLGDSEKHVLTLFSADFFTKAENRKKQIEEKDRKLRGAIEGLARKTLQGEQAESANKIFAEAQAERIQIEEKQRISDIFLKNAELKMNLASIPPWDSSRSSDTVEKVEKLVEIARQTLTDSCLILSQDEMGELFKKFGSNDVISRCLRKIVASAFLQGAGSPAPSEEELKVLQKKQSGLFAELNNAACQSKKSEKSSASSTSNEELKTAKKPTLTVSRAGFGYAGNRKPAARTDTSAEGSNKPTK